MRIGVNYKFWWNKLARYSFGEFIVFVQSAYLRRKILNRAEKNFSLTFNHQPKHKIDTRLLLFNIDGALPVHLFSSIVEEAGLILEHRFDLLGSGIVALSGHNGGNCNIAWHVDAISGFEWPVGKFFKKYNSTGASPGVDIKFTRELSRFQHLSILGMAHHSTKNAIYVDEFVNQITDWIDHNPFCYSINWECAMDVSIRAVNWIVGLDFFIGAISPLDPFMEKFESSLYNHAIFISAFLEYREAPVNGKIISIGGNHYLSNLCGLLFICNRFPKWKESKNWKKFALLQFYREVDIQITDSGINYEYSTGYHRLSLEMAFYTMLLLERNGESIPENIRRKLERAFEFVYTYSKPDGSVSMFGDSDNGQFIVFGKRELSSHQYLLQLGAIYFDRRDFISELKPPYLGNYFLFDSSKVSEWIGKPPVKKTFTPHIYSKEKMAFFHSDGLWFFVNASGVGTLGHGGHTHNDLLSFELSFEKDNFLIDCGTYTYSRSPEERNLFRSTRSHNTVTIDGQEQQQWTEGYALWSYETQAQTIMLRADVDPFIFSAEHDGYQRLGDPVTHCRTIKMEENVIKLADEFRGLGKNIVEWNWHIGPDIRIEKIKNSQFILTGKESYLILNTPDIQTNIAVGSASSQYGVKFPIQVIRMQAPITSLIFRFNFSIQKI